MGKERKVSEGWWDQTIKEVKKQNLTKKVKILKLPAVRIPAGN